MVLYAILLFLLAVIIDYGVGYVRECVDIYEASQPEHVVEASLSTLLLEAREGKLSSDVVFDSSLLSKYEIQNAEEEYKNRFLEQIASSDNLNYKQTSDGYSETIQSYDVYADDRLVARLDTRLVSSDVLLSLLNVNNFTMEGIYPEILKETYSVIIRYPEDFKVHVNGILLDPHDETVDTINDKGFNISLVNGLHDIPAITILDRYNNACEVLEEDGIYSPATFSYSVVLPKSFELYEGETLLEGTAEGENVENVSYSLVSIYDHLTVKDSYGHTVIYKDGDKIDSHDVLVTLPSNYDISIKDECMSDRPISEFEVSRKEIDNYKYCEEYQEMPRLVTFKITDTLSLPEFIIFDNKGEEVTYVFEDNKLIIENQAGEASVPEEILSEINPLELAKMWSLYMSDDLEGDIHGYVKLDPYLIKGTYIQQTTRKWASSVDITFTSNHTTPVFERESMTNYISFGPDLFSVDIYLEKKLYVPSTDLEVTDIIHARWYFYKYQGQWKLIDISEKLN